MAYLIVEDFKEGIDLRKSAVSSKQGSLRQLSNGFISAGGEVEKRKAFTSVGVCPTGTTFGLGFLNDRIAVFGTTATPGTLPPYTDYYKLVPTTAGQTIDRIMTVRPFSLGLYVIARLANLTYAHFYVTTSSTNQIVGRTGTAAVTHKNKEYVVDGRNLWFSALGDPTSLVGTGSGGIDVTAQDGGAQALVGVEQYYSFLALLSRGAVQVWAMDPDPTKNALVQVLGNIGLVAPNGMAKYGNGDLMFLSDTGVRSLRARDASNAAVLNDIGSPIDSYVAAKRATLTTAIAEKISAIVDPLSGHFWLMWGGEILLFAYYPNSNITAWSTMTSPFTVDHSAVGNSRVILRSGEGLYVYGSVPPSGSPFDPNTPLGSSAALYDNSVVTAELPFIDVGKPATVKIWQGLDVACDGTWSVYVNPDHLNPTAYEHLCDITGNSFGLGRIPIDLQSTHLALKFISVGTGNAKLARVVVHYDDGSEESPN